MQFLTNAKQFSCEFLSGFDLFKAWIWISIRIVLKGSVRRVGSAQKWYHSLGPDINEGHTDFQPDQSIPEGVRALQS